jgi:hypothetical protein
MTSIARTGISSVDRVPERSYEPNFGEELGNP